MRVMAIALSFFLFLFLVYSPTPASPAQIPMDEIRSLFASIIPGTTTRDEAHSRALDSMLIIGRLTTIRNNDDAIIFDWNRVYKPVPQATVGIYLKNGVASCVNYYIYDGEIVIEKGFKAVGKEKCGQDK